MGRGERPPRGSAPRPFLLVASRCAEVGESSLGVSCCARAERGLGVSRALGVGGGGEGKGVPFFGFAALFLLEETSPPPPPEKMGRGAS